MKISYDVTRCCSSGMCESFAPDVFEVDDDGALQILDLTPAEELRGPVEMAVASCPTEALRLDE